MLDTLIELQRLKRLDRTGWTLRGLANGTESVAAHSFGVSATAMFLADELMGRGITIDVDKMLRMALLHDWAEARVGDLPKTATRYFGSELRKQAEMNALADMTEGLSAGSLYRSLHQEYELRESIEARLVKAADVIDLLVQALALERGGARGLDEFWEVAETADFKLNGQPQELIAEMMQGLLSARAVILDRQR